ncbi:NfeD family protein [Alkalimarinus alittae]|uniref:NfeD family protein n=1 Tax=Alkalimarinus alittae TaxID=2961619 RepID=A0ABY6MXT6_9ALTE|nr:NfeD family protein [Alkalimarinus alittae]UZE94594.1 NfeD family protein [Alkalimarinus alittae]
MVEWLDANILYWHWVVFGILLAGAEIFAPSFFLLWLGVSGLLVGFISYFVNISFSTEIILWGVFSLASLVIWFKLIAPLMKNNTLSGMSREALIGQEGTITEYNQSVSKGRLRFSAPIVGNDEWGFRCEQALSVGDRAVVTDVSGNDLIVRKK